MPDNMFKIVYFVEFVVISAVRAAQTRQYRRLSVAVDRRTLSDMVLLALAGTAMLMPLVYIFSSIFDFADYDLPNWLAWLGTLVFASAIWLLWRSHADLGSNWTPTLGLRGDHRMVTDGVFRHIRHPMYAAHILWGIAAVMMLHNWIAGPALLVATVAQYLARVGSEERMMLEYFGEQYASYMRQTGRIIPRVRK